MSTSANLTEAFHQGAWLPCRVMDVNPTEGIMLVQVRDRTGVIELWVPSEHVRGR